MKNCNQPAGPLFHELKILDFDKHKFLTISSFIWQVTYGNIPDTIKSSFNIRNRDNSIHSANTHNLIFIIKTMSRSKTNLLFSNF